MKVQYAFELGKRYIIIDKNDHISTVYRIVKIDEEDNTLHFIDKYGMNTSIEGKDMSKVRELSDKECN